MQFYHTARGESLMPLHLIFLGGEALGAQGRAKTPLKIHSANGCEKKGNFLLIGIVGWIGLVLTCGIDWKWILSGLAMCQSIH